MNRSYVENGVELGLSSLYRRYVDKGVGLGLSSLYRRYVEMVEMSGCRIPSLHNIPDVQEEVKLFFLFFHLNEDKIFYGINEN